MNLLFGAIAVLAVSAFIYNIVIMLIKNRMMNTLKESIEKSEKEMAKIDKRIDKVKKGFEAGLSLKAKVVHDAIKEEEEGKKGEGK